MPSEFVLPAGLRRREAVEVLIRFIRQLDLGSPWRWTCIPYKPRRSQRQNSYLWGVCYATILKEGSLEGWVAEDLHDFFLGEHFGWETIYGFRKRRIKPIRRSSKLSTTEFMEYVAFIQRYMSAKGVVIPDPHESDL